MQTTSQTLVVIGRRPAAPVVAFAAPQVGATIVEGSLRLVVDAIAGDDTGVAQVEIRVHGQTALVLAPSPVPIMGFDDEGRGLADDVAERTAIASLPAPFDDATAVERFLGVVDLPPGDR